MRGIEAETGTGRYALKSEMARLCLPAPHAHAQRNLAWANSICLLFLIIGLAGFRRSPPPPPPIKPIEEVAPVLIEPVTPPPTTVDTKPEEQPTDDNKSAAPQVVVVTPESPEIKFSVPTIGNYLVPRALAVAPPAVALQAVAPTRKIEPPAPLNNTGEGGDRPAPSYPTIAKEMGQQGAVVLLLTADEAGIITSVKIIETSGSPILDRSAEDFVKRHWTVAPGARGRLFEAKIEYKLR